MLADQGLRTFRRQLTPHFHMLSNNDTILDIVYYLGKPVQLRARTRGLHLLWKEVKAVPSGIGHCDLRSSPFKPDGFVDNSVILSDITPDKSPCRTSVAIEQIRP